MPGTMEIGPYGRPNSVPDFSARARGIERLDERHHREAELRAAVEHLVGVNRWLGGTRVILRHLRGHFPPSGARVLDVGTGAADIPLDVVRWGRARGWQITVFAVDRQSQIARIAKDRCGTDRAVRIAVGDGLVLPFSTDSFDAVVSSMTLHHLDDDAALMFVAELGRVAREVVIVNDLHRHRLNYLGARLLANTVWRHDGYTKHDGPLSVLRSFNERELLHIGRASGLGDPRVYRHFPYRLALVGRPAA